MDLTVRQLAKKDFKPYKKLFDEAYREYLENLKRSNLRQYRKEMKDIRKVTSSRFNFYVDTGSSFVAEKNGEVIGYVAGQTVNYQHGIDRLLWIEYIVTKKEYRRQGVATLLLSKLVDHAKHKGIDRIYTTINPDNAASLKLHQKLGFDVKNWITASLSTEQQAPTTALE